MWRKSIRDIIRTEQIADQKKKKDEEAAPRKKNEAGDRVMVTRQIRMHRSNGSLIHPGNVPQARALSCSEARAVCLC